MQIKSRFTAAVHIIAAAEHFKDSVPVTSGFLSGSTGVNPVIVREIMSELRSAGIISVSRGKSGIALARDPGEITLYDIYRAVDCVDDEGLFRFHSAPNPACPVGRNIHRALDSRLEAVQRAMEEEMRAVTMRDIAADVESFIAEEPERKDDSD